MALAIAVLAAGFLLLLAFEIWRSSCVRSEQERALLGEKEAVEGRRQELGELQAAVAAQDRAVSDLVSLFEVAREFNECMDFFQVAEVMTGPVYERVPYRASRLLFVDEETQRMPLIFDPAGNLEEGKALGMLDADRRLSAYLARTKRELALDSRPQEHALDLDTLVRHYPFWAFPLMSGNEMIAVLLVEGARGEEFDKFHILATQLALHVKRIRLYNTVKELAIVDDLTQMFVRRHFLERFDEELRRSLARRFPMAVLMLDIDHFKGYNDSFGHLAGDHALREVARRVRDSIRPVDVPARYGGEEFVVVLPETDQAIGLEVGERIRAAVAQEPIVSFGEQTRLTVSVGVAAFPGDLPDAQAGRFHPYLALDLLKAADRALYDAKARGRNCVAAYDKRKEASR